MIEVTEKVLFGDIWDRPWLSKGNMFGLAR
jgi:hypothetical protein